MPPSGEERLPGLEKSPARVALGKLRARVESNLGERGGTDIRIPYDPAKRKEKVERQLASLPGLAEVVGNVETVKDLRQLNVETLIKLENKYEGILLYAFTDIVGETEKIDFAKWETYTKPRPGMRLQVDFRGNIEAETKLGAADILPPSIRHIKVYEDGAPNRTRESEARVGLKGCNVGGRGFFDKNGYIPVFSGDVIEIKEVNEKFDEPFRTKTSDGRTVLDEAAYKRYEQSYEQSEEGKRAREFVERTFRENPAAQRGKIMSESEIQALMEKFGSSAGERVAKMAVELIRGKRIRNSKCCWDWVDKIYKAAGAKLRRIYQDLGYEGKDCGDRHAGPALMNALRPGDWLYINNQNRWDRKGCHSVIFLEWIDKNANMARCASSPRAGSSGRIHLVDFNKSPVTHISKPVPA